MPKLLLLFLFAVAAPTPLAATAAFKDTVYYPYVIVDAASSIEMTFLLNARRDKSSCEALTANVMNGILTVCSTCQVKRTACLDALEPQHEKLLSVDPIPLYSARFPDGVVTYFSSDDATASAACAQSVQQSALSEQAVRVICYPPNVPRPFPAFAKTLGLVPASVAFLMLLFAGVACGLACYMFIRYEHLHAHFSHDHVGSGPQKFHAAPAPRIGGIGLLLGLLVAGAVSLSTRRQFPDEEFGLLLLAALPAFAAGIAEDVTKKIGVMARLVFTMLAAAACAWLLKAVVPRLDIPGIDILFQSTAVALAFTIFAVAGVANAINIIDGYHGLAPGYAVIVLGALAWISAQVGDTFLATAALTMVGALLGFLVWNYPRGKMFLGDRGAYLIGFWLAEISVLLVARHPEVSPWFPLLLLIYPVFEVVFSIYRRKFLRGDSPSRADALHLHHLIHWRLLRQFAGSRDPELITQRNTMVAPYVWVISCWCVLPAVYFWRDTAWLIAFILLFCALYCWLYRRIVSWRTPPWLIAPNLRMGETPTASDVKL